MVDAIDTIKILGSLLGNGGPSSSGSSNILKSVLGAAAGGKTQGPKGGDLANILGGLMGAAGKSKSGGGLGGILGSVLGSAGKQQGGLGGLLGGVLKGKSRAQVQPQSGGMGDLGSLGGLLGGLLGGGAAQAQAGNSGGLGGLGGLLESAIKQYGQSKQTNAPATSHQHCDHLPAGMQQQQATDQATLMIQAMCNAAKSDGQFDKSEQSKMLERLGDLSQQETDFVRSELEKPLEVDGFIRSVPDGMQQQVYAISLMTIDLDTQQEAQYLHQLAQGLGISQQLANQIHQQLGAPVLYS